ncbi:MAG: hypothetical protein MUC51_07930 [Anaerolineae bacterium]|nr:hypothetical protein [Anaerolineae bacterium]
MTTQLFHFIRVGLVGLVIFGGLLAAPAPVARAQSYTEREIHPMQRPG